MTCEFAHLDGAYVLGSLSPADRAEYERHLRGCDECTRAVRDLAGLPGLMAKVPLEALEPPGEHEPVPATLLPAVVAEARRSQRRRRTAIGAVVAAAAAVAVVAVTGVVVATMDDDEAPPSASPTETLTTTETPTETPSTAPAVRMKSLGRGLATGWVSLTEKAWGTQIDLTCRYRQVPTDGYGGGGVDYAMVVRGADGRVEQVGTWRVESGKEARVTLATSLKPGDIRTVVVQTTDGFPVLRLAQ